MFKSVTAASESVVAVGYSLKASFDNGDLAGIPTKGGSSDAIIVKYSMVPVTNITGPPSVAVVGTPLTLTGIVTPSDASNKTIIWSVKNAGTTGAKISGSVLSTTGEGTVVVTATILNGSALGDFTKDFAIEMRTAYSITVSCDSRSNISPTGKVIVLKGDNQTFTFSAMSGCTLYSVTVDGVALTAAEMSLRGYTFTNVTADHTISVSSKNVDFYISASADMGSSISPSGSVAVQSWSNKTFTFSAKSGESIVSVSVDGVPISQAEMARGSYTFTNVLMHHTITVKSTDPRPVPPPPTYYTIEATADNWSNISPSGKVSVLKGSSQTFTFGAKSGYEISSVTVDGKVLTKAQVALGSYTFSNVAGNHTIDVNGIVISATFNITGYCDANSTISPKWATVLKGNDQSFSFSALQGYCISTVLVDGLPLSQGIIDSGTYTFRNVVMNHTIEVRSVTSDYSITVTHTKVSDGLMYTPIQSSKIGVYAGFGKTIDISPMPGCFIFNVIVDGVALSRENRDRGEYSFTSVQSNHTVEIIHAPIGGISSVQYEYYVVAGYTYMNISSSNISYIWMMYMRGDHLTTIQAGIKNTISGLADTVTAGIIFTLEGILAASLWKKCKEVDEGNGVTILMRTDITGMVKDLVIIPQ
jgi:hypothetical protein